MGNSYKYLKFRELVGNGTSQEWKSVSYRDAISSIKEKASNSANNVGGEVRYSTAISTELSAIHSVLRPRFFSRKHILVLSGESQSSLNIERFLERNRVDFFRVRKGTEPGQYWYFCSKIGTIDELCSFMGSGNVVPTEYIEKVRADRSFLISASPKDGEVPHTSRFSVDNSNEASRDTILARFNNTGEHIIDLWKFSYLVAWVLEFKKYWDSFAPNGANFDVITNQKFYLDSMKRLDTINDINLDINHDTSNRTHVSDFSTQPDPSEKFIDAIDSLEIQPKTKPNSRTKKTQKETFDKFNPFADIKL